MSFFSLLRRLALFILALALPFAALGLALGRVKGFVAVELLLATFLMFASFYAEKGILNVYGVRHEAPEGARRSLARVLAAMGETDAAAPRVLSFSDPSPQALVVRSPFSRGSILLSEGLLGSLSESELRELLDASVARLRARGICFQSVCAWCAHLTLELAPRSWIELIFGELRWHDRLGVFSALGFVAVFSIAKFFVGLGRVSWSDAPHRLARLPAALGEVANPGSCILHFSDPWTARALFRL